LPRTAAKRDRAGRRLDIRRARSSQDRRLRRDRRLPDGGSGFAGRLDRLAVPAPLLGAERVCGAARPRARRPLRHPPRASCPNDAPICRGDAGAGDDLRDLDRHGPPDRSDAAGRESGRASSDARGAAGRRGRRGIRRPRCPIRAATRLCASPATNPAARSARLGLHLERRAFSSPRGCPFADRAGRGRGGRAPSHRGTPDDLVLPVLREGRYRRDRALGRSRAPSPARHSRVVGGLVRPVRLPRALPWGTAASGPQPQHSRPGGKSTRQRAAWLSSNRSWQ
jgi:hypothetical protein